MQLQINQPSPPALTRKISKPALNACHPVCLEGDLELDGSLEHPSRIELCARGPGEAEALAMLGD